VSGYGLDDRAIEEIEQVKRLVSDDDDDDDDRLLYLCMLCCYQPTKARHQQGLFMA
jgi:hypothetical protein